MTGVRFMAVLLFLLALVLIFVTPISMVENSLGDPGPALLPRIVGIITALLAVSLWFQNVPAPDVPAERQERPAVITWSVLSIPAFYLMFQYLGYTIAVGIYLLVASSLLGTWDRAHMFRYGLAAIAFSLVSGLTFGRLLDLPLPGVLP